jgi:hypothetical protein
MTDSLKVSMRVAIAALVLSVLPIWPYGLYTLLRIFITGVSLYALYSWSDAGPTEKVGLVLVAMLFNPIAPVYLSKLIWLPIDLGVAFWFYRISFLVKSE